MEFDTRQITITTPYGGRYNTNNNYNSHMEVDTIQITIKWMIRVSKGSRLTGFWDCWLGFN